MPRRLFTIFRINLIFVEITFLKLTKLSIERSVLHTCKAQSIRKPDSHPCELLTAPLTAISHLSYFIFFIFHFSVFISFIKSAICSLLFYLLPQTSL